MSSPDQGGVRLGRVERSPFSGAAYRHQSARHDPRSGEGARIHGGRFNPPESFPVLYLCLDRPCAVAELKRLGRRAVVGIDGLLPRLLYRYELDLERVLDLTDAGVVAELGTTREALTADDWSFCQEIGVASHAQGDQGILCPSATGTGTVLAVFPVQLGLGLRDVQLAERWDEVGQLNATDDRLE